MYTCKHAQKIFLILLTSFMNMDRALEKSQDPGSKNLLAN